MGMPVTRPALFRPPSPGERAGCLPSLLSCFCYYTVSKSALNTAPVKWFMIRPSDLLTSKSSDPENIFHLLPFSTCPEVCNCWLFHVFSASSLWVYRAPASSQFSGYPPTSSATCIGSFSLSQSYMLVSLRLVSCYQFFLVMLSIALPRPPSWSPEHHSQCLIDYSYLCPPGPSHLACLKLTPPSFLTNQLLSQDYCILKRNAACSQLWRLSLIPPQCSLANRALIHVSSIINHEARALHAQCFFFLYSVSIVPLAFSLK